MYLLRQQGKFICCLFVAVQICQITEAKSSAVDKDLSPIMAHAGFTSRGLQIMIFRGSCYSFILSRVSSKHVVSQPLIKTLNFQFGF